MPVPDRVNLVVRVAGADRAVCCAGCAAVTRAIVDAGLADYYRNRQAFPESPAEAADALKDLGLYDHAAVQKAFVRPAGAGEREASLILEGITCAACVWLNERHLATLPGVTGVAINYATRRARVRWDESQTRLSQILAAIATIGYRAHPYDPARYESIAGRERREALWRLFVAAFGAMQVMMYAFPAYIAGEGELSPDIARLMRWASLILTAPVIAYSCAPFFRNAWRDFKARRAGMDVPVALGVAVGFAASTWATVADTGEVYFDSVSMFVFLLLGGRYLEMQARQKAAAAGEALARQLPTVACRLADYPASLRVESVAAADLAADDFVLVKPGETLPADGCVVEGTSAIDESLLTGEARPVERSVGDAVIGGAVNGGGTLIVRVVAAGETTRLASILHLMERASLERPRLVELADRAAARFVFWILLAALAVFGVWLWLDAGRALWIAVAVLVATCPCALSLATPTVMVVAHGRMARTGLLVTRGHAVETLARVSHVVFDKTGTLTEGRYGLDRVETFGAAPADDCRRWAASLESVSEHAVARVLREAHGGPVDRPQAFRVDPGRGVEGACAGRVLRIGRADYVAALSGKPLPRLSDDHGDGGSTVWLGDGDGLLAAFHLRDRVRDDAADTVARLFAAGLEVSLLSGDCAEAVGALARRTGIDHWRAGCLPEDKLAYVKALQAEGAVVAMVGDGINDAPVLAAAQLSIALSGGADLTKVGADCLLLGERLSAIGDGLATARRALAIVRQNLAWSLAYNGVALPVAAFGGLTPWLAGVGMAGSSLVVVLNALRLR